MLVAPVTGPSWVDMERVCRQMALLKSAKKKSVMDLQVPGAVKTGAKRWLASILFIDLLRSYL